MSQKTITAKAEDHQQAGAHQPVGAAEMRYAIGDLEATLGTMVKARVLNMSLTGVGLKTSQYLEIGKAYPLRLSRGSERLGLQATVVWSRLVRTVAIGQGEVLPIFMAGLRFSDVSEATRERLVRLLGEYPPILRPGPSRRGAAAARPQATVPARAPAHRP